MLDNGDAQLWLGEKSALVALVEEHPTGPALCIWLAGGDLEELVQELRPKAEAWGRAQGCNKVTIMGRRGWVKALSPVGYKPTAVVMTKEL